MWGSITRTKTDCLLAGASNLVAVDVALIDAGQGRPLESHIHVALHVSAHVVVAVCVVPERGSLLGSVVDANTNQVALIADEFPELLAQGVLADCQ